MRKNNVEGMSLVIPFYNEQEGISFFCETIDEYAKNLSFPIELIFVNDGSTDDSYYVVNNYKFKHVNKVKLLDLSKNFGSQGACRAGLTKASYNICTWLGSDLQEPLEILPLSYEKIIHEEYDAVYIEKKTIETPKMERAFSKFYSWLVKKYAIKEYPCDGISNIVFSGKVLNYLNNNIENNSSIILQIIDAGYNAYSFSMDYKARYMGESKWTFSKKVKQFIDSFVSFSFMPIRLVSYMGIIIFIIGIIVGTETIINKLINPNALVGYASIFCVLAFGFGITNISLGIIAEYLWRTYDSTRNRPVFIISNEIDLK